MATGKLKNTVCSGPLSDDAAEKLAANVRARKCCNTLVELGISLGKEEGLSPDGVRRMWQYVMETAAELIGDKIAEPEPPPRDLRRFVPVGGVSSQKRTLWANSEALDDDDPFPFGKFKGDRMADVPDSYLHWCSQQDWIDNWPAVFEYIQANELD